MLATALKVAARKNTTVNLEQIATTLQREASTYGLDTLKAKQYFLANALHETDGLNTLEEYASGAAYEGRKDLGNTQKGDGKKFKGRGIFQITGRYNYEAVSLHLFGDRRLLDQPELLLLPEYAVKSALWYWQNRKLSAISEQPNGFETVVRRINGGLNGYEDRKRYLKIIESYISSNEKFGTAQISAIVGIAIGAIFFIKYLLK